MNGENKIQYNECKNWQIICFSLNTLIGNSFMLLMNFVSYLAVGEYAILTGVASIIITASRLLDGVTDPVIALIVDKTNCRFGRYRPMMVLGYILLTVSVLAMYFFCIGGNIIVFILLYVLYIIGYTFLNTASGGARSVITNEPTQRGQIGRWCGIMMQIVAVGFSFYMSNYLARKHRGINIGALQELAMTAIIIAGVCLVLSVLALRDKDKPEYYQGLNKESLRIKDVWKILKGNRNLQMMIVAASSDKLAQQTAGNAAVTMLIWGIVAGNYAFSGQLNLITLVPMILIMFYGTHIAMRKGSRNATIKYSLLNIASGFAIAALFVFGNPKMIGKSIPVTLVFLVLYCIYSGGKGVTNAVVQPMLSDVADYELYRTGKFMPGVVNAVYSFVDKLITSLSATIVGLILSMIGYADTMPQATDPYSTKILVVGLFIWLGLPIIGWTCSVIAMKWYDLDTKRMEEIQREIAEKKKAMKK